MSLEIEQLNLAQLYDKTPNSVWEMILDEYMNYHFGEPGPFSNVFENEVYNRLKFFDDVNTVLDVGAGWGGPASVIQKHLPHIEVTCLTNANEQIPYLQNRGFDTMLADGDTFSSDRKFDLILFNESYAHMRDDALKNFYPNTDRVVYKDWVSTEYFFDPPWQMHFRTPEQTIRIFEDAGFNVQHYKELEHSYVESATFWFPRIQGFEQLIGREVSPDYCPQIKLLKDICHRILNGNLDDSKIRHCEIYATKGE